VVQPSLVNKFPFKRGTGVPELKLSPANSPKYQLAASFCENSKEELTIKKNIKILTFKQLLF
jgi:hypothetical protein